MPLALPNRANTPWWAWLSGGLGVGFAAFSIAYGVTAEPGPDTSCASLVPDSNDARACVKHAERVSLSVLTGVTAAPLLTIPLVYLLRRTGAKISPNVEVSRAGGYVSLSGGILSSQDARRSSAFVDYALAQDEIRVRVEGPQELGKLVDGWDRRSLFVPRIGVDRCLAEIVDDLFQRLSGQTALLLEEERHQGCVVGGAHLEITSFATVEVDTQPGFVDHGFNRVANHCVGILPGPSLREGP